jgi:CHAT domain-containing protein/tetratricopeptide (TPR) repeat protein
MSAGTKCCTGHWELMVREQGAGHAASVSAPSERGKLHVFISYSRDDLDFADELDAILRIGGFDTSVDRQAISGGEEWRRRLGNLIREADTVVFVLSASSARSDICAWEVEEAVRSGKRIIPAVPRPLDGAMPPQHLRDLNYIFFYPEPKSPGSGFGPGLTRLVEALNTDLEWLREHTRLLLRATEWDAGGRSENRLLSGTDIVAAKSWAARRPKGAPEPTTLHLDFIRVSEEVENARQDLKRRQAEEMEAAARSLAAAARKTLRRTVVGLVVSTITIVAAVTFAWMLLEKRAEDARETAASAETIGETSRMLLEAGEINRALRSAKEGLRFAEALSNRRPNDATQQRNVAVGHLRLGDVLRAAGHPTEAMTEYQKALELQEKVLGHQHPDLAQTLNSIVSLLVFQGRYSEAESKLVRALEIRKRAIGQGHPYVAKSMNDLADVYYKLARYGAAETLQRKALAIREASLGDSDPEVARSLAALARVIGTEGKLSDAEPLYRRALSIDENNLGADDPSVARDLKGLAQLLALSGRSRDAKPLFDRALIIDENAYGPEHPEVSADLNDVAKLYRSEGRYDDAEQLTKRALAIDQKTFGQDHPVVAADLNGLAEQYRLQAHYNDAEPLVLRALTIDKRALGPDHPDVATELKTLAELYHATGRWAEAEPLYVRYLAIMERALGPGHSDVATALDSLGGLFLAVGGSAAAAALLARALAVDEKALGPDHPDVGRDLNDLAFLYFSQGQWSQATEFWRRATSLVFRRVQLDALNIGRTVTGNRKSDPFQLRSAFVNVIKASFRVSASGLADVALQREMFRMAQSAQSLEAAASLAQALVRNSKGDSTLAKLVRERQDLVAEWRSRDADRAAAMSQPPEKRDVRAENVLISRLDAIDARIGEIDQVLAQEFPNYAALSAPAPLSIEEVQSRLAPDEAVVLILDTPEEKPTPEETFIWVVTKMNSRWVRSDVGTNTLNDAVAKLRCGLDLEGAWLNQDGSINPHCTDLLKVAYTDEYKNFTKPLPFDLDLSHSLYKTLFGSIEELIKGKRLLLVTSGPLTQLPFNTLVTDKPTVALPASYEGYRSVVWFARNHAVTTLPAVFALTQREFVAPSHAKERYIAFGDPLLEGERGIDDFAAKQARDKQQCSIPQRVAPISNIFRGGLGDVSQIRTLPPLPETADEVCEVAHMLGVDPNLVHLGARATKTEVKRLSEDGTLAQYKIVHFATHGGPFGLVLTPPATPTAIDDGVLTVSEISELKLDADWVILSACNTASGDVSGIEQAFFYAGARSLLVSQWSVESFATQNLITRAFEELTRDSQISPAEAMRRSMLLLMESGKSQDVHPAFWAPFVLVGDSTG